MMNKKNIYLLSLCVFVGLFLWLIKPEPDVDYFAVWSLLPAMLTMLACFITRNIVFSLFLGVVCGGIVSDQLNVFSAFVLPALERQNITLILLLCLCALGCLLGLWNRNGGVRYVIELLAKRFVYSRNSAKLFAWVLGVLFHQGGTFSTVLVGSTVRPLSDKYAVAHEELSYIVDSTASPVATILPFNMWPIYVSGLLLIEPLSGLVPDQAAAIKLYFMSVPFNFYAWISVVMTLLFALGKLPLFNTTMGTAVKRVRTSGELDAPNARLIKVGGLTELKRVKNYATGLLDFFAPIVTLFVFCFVPWLFGFSPMLFEGIIVAVIVALGISLLKGIPITVALKASVSAIKGIAFVATILTLALTLAEVANQLGTARYVIESTSAFFVQMPAIYPSLLLLVCMFVAFSVGSSWGTYAVVFPIALPLALVLSDDPIFICVCFAAIIGGAIFGDQCSPISDTTVLSAMACGADVMDHVTTQLPFSLFAAGVSAILYFCISSIVL